MSRKFVTVAARRAAKSFVYRAGDAQIRVTGLPDFNRVEVIATRRAPVFSWGAREDETGGDRYTVLVMGRNAFRFMDAEGNDVSAEAREELFSDSNGGIAAFLKQFEAACQSVAAAKKPGEKRGATEPGK